MIVSQAEKLARFNKRAFLFIALWLAVMASSLAVVYVSYEKRQLVSELNNKDRLISELHVEWGQYLLEHSTWTTYSRVETAAEDVLQMHVPTKDQWVVIEEENEL